MPVWRWIWRWPWKAWRWISAWRVTWRLKTLPVRICSIWWIWIWIFWASRWIWLPSTRTATLIWMWLVRKWRFPQTTRPLWKHPRPLKWCMRIICHICRMLPRQTMWEAPEPFITQWMERSWMIWSCRFWQVLMRPLPPQWICLWGPAKVNWPRIVPEMWFSKGCWWICPWRQRALP